MDHRFMIEIAKDAILEEFLQRPLIDRMALLKQYPILGKKGATFVTLEKRKALRGCIGTLVSHRVLLDDLIANAKSAAFRDSRFRPLTQSEFEDKNFTIEVSILSEPKQLSYKDQADLKRKIKVGVDGVILKHGNYQATFLPQVWEQLPRFEAFFSHLCQKAGMRSNCLEAHPKIYLYRVQKIKV
ncbi:MAG: AmmeMemoRadiSam system protein A [Epsilonproteobacteria bacterium]|nr:AmmeMemoRadiSam system protein A [Campylobacterota bacterium]